MKTSGYKKGHNAEKRACLFLMLKGYWPVRYNFRVGRGTGAGEVDLIMRRGRTLVFVEVKIRRTLTDALHAISPLNQARIVRTSAVFLARNPQYKTYQVRYDAVLMAPKCWPRHIREAWRVL